MSLALIRLILGAVLVGVLLVGGTLFRVWQVARLDDRKHADVVVVLGAAQYDGTPSAVLGARLDHAARLWRERVAPVIVTVGGRRAGDTYTEAEAGRNYLTSYGIPGGAVVPIGQGRDTLESLRAVARRALAAGWHTAVIVSDPWHSLRARTMADDLGLVAWTSPTRSGPIVQTRSIQARYLIRESAALLHYRFTHAPAESFGTDLG
ncbi:MAG: YdcF family protein [Pseudonocardiales bacterium]|nr:YdcF family protein [Pseudonocardiales bacterium]